MPAASMTVLREGFTIAPCSHITDTNAIAVVREIVVPDDFGWTYYADMAERPPHYLREWRIHRGLTVAQLADKLGTSKSTISDLETYKLQLSPKWLRRLAPVLDVQQGHMIDHDPGDLGSDIIDIWTRIPERDRESAARALRGFMRTGTDD